MYHRYQRSLPYWSPPSTTSDIMVAIFKLYLSNACHSFLGVTCGSYYGYSPMKILNTSTIQYNFLRSRSPFINACHLFDVAGGAYVYHCI